MTTVVEQRVAAAQATLDHFKHKPFRWGERDCAVLVAFHLRQLGKTTPLRRFGNYRSALGARRALKANGFASLADVLDSMGLKRIAPAAAMVGDILALPGSDSLTALAILVGNGRAVGFHEEAEGAVVMHPSAPAIAWAVI